VPLPPTTQDCCCLLIFLQGSGHPAGDGGAWRVPAWPATKAGLPTPTGPCHCLAFLSFFAPHSPLETICICCSSQFHPRLPSSQHLPLSTNSHPLPNASLSPELTVCVSSVFPSSKMIPYLDPIPSKSRRLCYCLLCFLFQQYVSFSSTQIDLLLYFFTCTTIPNYLISFLEYIQHPPKQWALAF
jgi:hypothetical protein